MKVRKKVPFVLIIATLFFYAKEKGFLDDFLPAEAVANTGNMTDPKNSDSQFSDSLNSDSSNSDAAIANAVKNRQSDLMVQSKGRVIKVLPDDNEGSRHQKFILKLANNLTILIAHNIDLAPRIKGIQEGDQVEFAGEYEWTERGGVVHWTHKDPDGRHKGGWLKHDGVTYE